MTKSEIQLAVNILQSGGLVAFPTETVYGLGADARNEAALAHIFSAKGRPKDHPLIVHIGEIEQLSDWAREIPDAAFSLAQVFWPGPLTLILKKQDWVLDLLTAGQTTIGLRMPKHPMAQALLKAFGSGIAAPSANQFTHISPTSALAVKEELGEKVDLILDGGACEVGLESTILDLSREHPIILRPGMITAAEIETVLEEKVLSKDTHFSPTRAPGRHHLHYAPSTPTELLASAELLAFLKLAEPADLPLAVLAHSDFSEKLPSHLQHSILWKNMPSNAKDYARTLYHSLRMLDNQQLKRIMIEAVPEHTTWEAVKDRLVKASGRG